jgi:hypothetical protein
MLCQIANNSLHDRGSVMLESSVLLGDDNVDVARVLLASPV